MDPNKPETFDDGTIEIKTKEDFSYYINSLLEDFEENGDNWENNTVESFLRGIIAYTRDIDGYYKNMGFDTSTEIPTWRIFAQILKGASVYE